MQTKYVYRVAEGHVGCTPDSMNYFSTKRDAVAEMMDAANTYRDGGFLVRGSARHGLYSIHSPERPNEPSTHYIALDRFVGDISEFEES